MIAYGNDRALREAIAIVEGTRHGLFPRPGVHSFFDATTFTVSHVVREPEGHACAIIDSVLDFDAASGRTAGTSAERLARHVETNALRTQWILETHIHADHLSAASQLAAQLGGRIGIGGRIEAVQDVFGRIFNAGAEFKHNGSQFDYLFEDGDRFEIGALQGVALHVPGHTPACMAYVIGDAVFTGDTLFMPDYGTARCDFPGGDARALYRSIQRILGLPGDTRVFVCHDYKAPGRETYAWETTVKAQRESNIHLRADAGEQAFVAMRQARDATLPMPKLLIPSIQVNMRAGRLPEPEDNGVRYLKLPLDRL